MKAWFSALELAGLPGMPNSKRLVNLLDKSAWQSRPRVGRGGGLEYLVCDRYLTDEFLAAARDKFPERFTSTNPAEGVQMVQITHTKTANLADLKPEPAAPLAPVIDYGTRIIETIRVAEGIAAPGDKESQVIWARQEIVRICKTYVEEQGKLGIKEMEATTVFCRMVQEGSYPIPDWVRGGLLSKNGKVKISRSIIHIWKNKTAADLSPKHKGKGEQGFFDCRPEYEIAAEAVAREFGATPKQVHFAFASGLIADDFGLEEIPTEAQIAHWLRKRKTSNSQLARAFATGDKSIMRSAQGSYSRGLQPNDRWEADSTKADATAKKDNVIWLSSPFGETAVRCALVACIDVATRRVKVLLRPTSNGEAISLLVADSIRDWGLPKELKTDNGKDYIGKQVRGFCIAMAIEQKLCVVKQPWQKPHIERFMRTIQHSVEWKMLPWNTGHSVAMQQAYRKRREGDIVLNWTIAQFQSWIDSWVEAYHNRLHDSLGCSPNERLAAFRADGFVALMPKNLEQNLDFALLQEEEGTVNKGGIKHLGRNYIAPELQGRVGERFAFRIDKNDPNKIVVYSSSDLTSAELICIATWDMALTPEEQARIAATKPVLAQAAVEHEKAIKKAQRKIKTETASHPERLLPERGGVASFKAIQEIESATQILVDQISAVAAMPKVSETKLIAIEAHRQELNELEAARAAKPKPVDLDEVLRQAIKLWNKGIELDPEMTEMVVYYITQPTGFGALTVLAEMETWKPMKKWAEGMLKKWAADRNAAAS